ncbi:MAG: hypothetical protein EXS59_02805 [Candidatus Taylorbacteria bacterium]|nr:hypothetical protein [Candidatus Taylorbacteria bacterium]
MWICYRLSKRESFLRLAQKHSTPFYVYDQKELDDSIDRFIKVFQAQIPRFHAYYAVKLNHYPLIVKRVIEKSLGLDVASKRELSMAIDAGATKIVYFSPGKSEEDLMEAINHSDIVRLNMDSFNELRRLGAITSKMKRGVDASIRIPLTLTRIVVKVRHSN